MLIIAAKLYSDQGVPLPRHREITVHHSAVGILKLSERRERPFQRTMMVARLSSLDGGADVFPLLYDAVVIWIGNGEIRVRGFEINPTTGAHVAMVWGAEIMEDQRPSTMLTPPIAGFTP